MEIRADVRIYSGIFLIALAAVGVIIFERAKYPPKPRVKNFEECKAAGYPVTQSYPPQCSVPGGKFFVQKVVPER